MYFRIVRIRFPFGLAALVLFACQTFDYSPTVLEAERQDPHLNAMNLERIAALPGPRLHGKFAVMADTHLFYDQLRAAVDHINADSSIEFVVVAGDVTKYGYAEEYRIFSDIIAKIRAPVVVGVGNHDVQADGKALYTRLYGPTDFTFAWRGYEFVFFDDNARGIPDGIPDWGWLDSAMAEAGDSLRIIPVCHAPPYTDQLDSTQSQRLVQLYAKKKAVIVIGGHTHHYDYGEFFGAGIPYLVADDIGDRNYVLVTLDGGKASVERVFY